MCKIGGEMIVTRGHTRLTKALTQVALIMVAVGLPACRGENRGGSDGSGREPAPPESPVSSGDTTPLRVGAIIPSVAEPPSDSNSAVEIASRVLREGAAGSNFKVTLFVPVEDEYLVRLIPDPATVGGGGVVWISSTGTAIVLRLDR